jgi:hypothetical protein
VKKIFAILALGIVLMSSAFADLGTYYNNYPIYAGSINDPGVKVVEEQDGAILIEIDGKTFIIIK